MNGGHNISKAHSCGVVSYITSSITCECCGYNTTTKRIRKKIHDRSAHGGFQLHFISRHFHTARCLTHKQHIENKQTNDGQFIPEFCKISVHLLLLSLITNRRLYNIQMYQPQRNGFPMNFHPQWQQQQQQQPHQSQPQPPPPPPLANHYHHHLGQSNKSLLFNHQSLEMASNSTSDQSSTEDISSKRKQSLERNRLAGKLCYCLAV